MNRLELDKELKGRGLTEYDYYITGVSRHGLGGHGEIVLDREGSRWVTYSYERGIELDRRHFDTEDEACRYVFEYLTDTPPMGRRLTEDEAKKARQTQRLQIADYERWLRERSRKP